MRQIRKQRADSRGFSDRDLMERASDATKVKVHRSMSLNLIDADKFLANELMPGSDILTKGTVKLV